MTLARPEFVPDGSLSRKEMKQLQRDLAAAARFSDDGVGDPTDTDWAGDTVVAGVDQAFDGNEVTSAVVLLQDGTVLERVHATRTTEIPYIPGLLSFREGGAILDALDELTRTPDVLLVDGSGRLHYREAGLATHVGVTVDLPAVGVAKSLLCGTPRQEIDSPLPTGARIPIEADEKVAAEAGPILGYAVQTRQYESGNRHINPLYVSPGHRMSAETAADIVAATTGRYKLPDPIRRADALAADLTG